VLTRGRVTGRILASVLVAAFAVAIAVPAGVYAQSRRSLNGRLSSAKKQSASAKQEVARKRAAAQAAGNRLADAQQQLGAAESRLRRAQRRLAVTRAELVVVRKELEAAKKRLARHEKAMRARLLALYRQQEPSYVEVVLRSTSFEDFATRADFTRTLCRHDEGVFVSFVEDRREIETSQALLEKKEIEQKELEAKVEKEKQVVAAKAAEARSLREKSLTDLKAAEAQYNAMQRATREIEAQLARRSRGGGRHRHDTAWSGSLRRPVSGRITSGFGYRIHPILHTRRFHNGIDIGAGYGTPIHSADSGTVIFTGWKSAYGLTVLVDHGSGVSTMYAHCKRGSIRVHTGQKVSRGQVLAGVDSTGWSTGNHLHWSVFKNGRAVNPTTF